MSLLNRPSALSPHGATALATIPTSATAGLLNLDDDSAEPGVLMGRQLLLSASSSGDSADVADGQLELIRADDYALFMSSDPEVLAAHQTGNVQGTAAAVPPPPTSPVGSCWMFEPTGCPDGNNAAPYTAWKRDWWGEKRRQYAGVSGCALRARHLNGWCGVTDIRTSYVGAAVPPAPPQPAPSSPPGSCWVLKPSGCPKGDHTPASNAWSGLGSWAEKQSMYKGASGCSLRAKHLNGWCGTTDITTHYNPIASPPSAPPASPPPPFVLPKPPTAPPGSCWIIEPGGCPGGSKAGPQLTWKIDAWGMKQLQYQGVAGCAVREEHLNRWCKVTSIRTHYVAFVGMPPSPPPPSPPPTPKSGVPFATPDVQRRLLLAFNRSFSQTMLQVRYPDVLGGLDPSELRIGFHDDSFDQDTYAARPKWWKGSYTSPEPWLFMPRMVSGGAQQRYRAVPIGGEVRPELQSCIFLPNASLPSACPWVGGRQPLPFGTCVRQTHSSFQWDHHMDSTPDSQLSRAYHEVGGMGYVYYITELSVQLQNAKGTFTVTANVENRGVAPACTCSARRSNQCSVILCSSLPCVSSECNLLDLPSYLTFHQTTT